MPAGMASEETSTPTSAVLMAVAKHVAIRCHKENMAFTQCKRRDRNPEACLKEGDAVTQCLLELLKEARATAPDQMKPYVDCLDYYSNKFSKCRKEQKAFEEAFPPMTREQMAAQTSADPGGSALE